MFDHLCRLVSDVRAGGRLHRAVLATLGYVLDGSGADESDVEAPYLGEG